MKWIIPFLILLPMAGSCQLPQAGSFPAAREGSLIYLPGKGLFLLGGNSDDVWKWDGKWEKSSPPGPGVRDFFPGCYFPDAGAIYCFGGPDVPSPAFWSFDGERWTKVPVSGIGTRDHHQVVFMDHLKAFLVYGGANERGELDTLTWLIKDGKATGLNLPGPGIRYHFGMVYDKHRRKVVLYGGGKRASELWEFDGKSWEMIDSRNGPGMKLYHRMVYDEDRRRTILHGGWRNQDFRDPVNSLNPTTWEWDGNAWTKIAEGNVFALAFGYHTIRKKVFAYGRKGPQKDSGFALWELDAKGWTMIEEY